jgi:hypothetical protein
MIVHFNWRKHLSNVLLQIKNLLLGIVIVTLNLIYPDQIQAIENQRKTFKDWILKGYKTSKSGSIVLRWRNKNSRNLKLQTLIIISNNNFTKRIKLMDYKKKSLRINNFKIYREIILQNKNTKTCLKSEFWGAILLIWINKKIER